MSNLSLFPDPTAADEPRRKLAAKLRGLARSNVWIGTSSWKYPGWLGNIYTPERYSTHGRFSKKRFEETCLSEYAETFPIVCGDFAFYQFPSEAYWRKLLDMTPESFRFAFKVPEEITVRRWPSHLRYGSRAGSQNESFLNAELMERLLLKPLAHFGERLALLIFEFGTFAKLDFATVAQFAETLDVFLAQLPRQFRYAVEIRNREYLERAYFQCLRRHGVAHVFNGWTRMPEIGDQISIPQSRTADFTVVRALLRIGRTYEQAVAQFSPYEAIQDPNQQARDALRALIDQAVTEERLAMIFVNNRFEGNAPATIEAIVD